MKVYMVLELEDVPGSLIRALEPISSHGGNIMSVFHSRGKKEEVDVQITFSVADESSLDLMKKSLEKRRIRVKRIELEGKRYYSKKTVAFILVGHVIDKNIQDTIDRINEIGLVSDVDVMMPDPSEKSSVWIKVDVDENKRDRVVSEVEKICKQKDFLFISSLG